MEPGPQRDIAQAEYHYFSGHPEAAALEAEPYLHSQDQGARLSASLIFAFSNLSLGRIPQAKKALARLQASLSESGSPELQAAAALAATAGTVLLHLPQPSGLPEMARASTSRRSTPPAWGPPRPPWPWAAASTPSPPSTSTWWR